MDVFLALDRQLTLIIRNILPHSTYFDFLFRTLSLQGFTIIIWIITVAAVLAWETLVHHDKSRYLQKIIPILILTCLTIGLGTGITEFFLKPIFGRDRPYEFQQINAPYCPANPSFPSGHATAAVVGAVILAYFDHNHRRDRLYACIALVVCFSRIYLDCHYLLDVGVGAVLGYALAQGVLVLAEKADLVKKYKKIIKY